MWPVNYVYRPKTRLFSVGIGISITGIRTWVRTLVLYYMASVFVFIGVCTLWHPPLGKINID